MAALERRMSTSNKRGKGEDKDKPEWVDMLERKLTETIEGQSKTVMKRIANMEEKVKKEIDGVKLEVKKSVARIGEVELKTKKLEKDLMDNTRKLQERLLLMDCKMLELYLRFRRVKEEQGNTREQMVTLLADYLKKPCEEIDKNCD